MNVLFLQNHGGVGGAQKSLLDLLEGFRSAAAPVDAHVILGERGYLADALEASGFRCEIVPIPEFRKFRDILKRFSFPSRLKGICARRGIDLVHANTDQVAPWSALAAAKVGIPSCCTVRELAPLRRLRKNRVLDNDAVIAISRAVEDCIPLPRWPGHVHQVYNAIRAPDFLTREAAIKALGLSATAAMRVIYLGQLAARKSPEVFINAAAQVVKAGMASVEFVLIGGSSAEAMSRLQARAAGAGLAQVTFVGERPDGSTLLKAFDLLVQPSAIEGLGRVTVEAMHAGLPVVAANGGATREIVVPGLTGQLFAPGDASALARAILKYANDPALGRAHGAAGKARAAELFDPGRTATRVAEVYQALPANRGSFTPRHQRVTVH